MDEEVEAAAPADDSATPPEAPEASEPAPADDTAPTSMASALAEALAELEAAEESTKAVVPDAPASEEKPAAQDSEATPEQPPSETSRKVTTSQGELDRILTLVKQNREAELDPAARGVLRSLRESVVAEQQKEADFRKLYLGYEAERLEDAEAFADKVIAEPAVAQFMRAYKAAHPDVSLENPNAGPKTPTPDEVRATVDAEYADAVTQTVAAIAKTAGLDDPTIARLQAETGGRLGEFMARSFDEAVRASVAKQLPEITRKEREAAELEAQARYANKTIITPRVVGGLPVTGERRDPSAPFSMRDAIREAQAELDAAGVS